LAESVDRQRPANVPWPIAVSFLIRPLPDEFGLSDVYAIADPVRRAFPTNRHVEAKIRQSLQILRDRGEIAFVGRGRYRKLAAAERRSVRIDFSEAANYVSASQVARVAIETWVARNVVCWRCSTPLIPLPANERLKDVVCQTGEHDVQVKAHQGVAGDRLTGAAFAPMARRLEVGTLPDYLVVSYDKMRAIVLLAEYIDGASLAIERLVARKPLSAGARRAGWVGATIDLSGLERRVVVGPSFAPDVDGWSGSASGDRSP
jgi:hypothetical protein